MFRRALPTLIALCCLTAIGVVGRLASYEMHWWNFTPVAAVGLFAGFYFERKSVAALATVAVLSLSNLQIGGYPHVGVMFTVYAALLAPILLRSWLREQFSVGAVAGASLISSVVFFLSTNFAHYWFTLPHTSENFQTTFVNALPFFRMTLAGDLLFSALLFGAYAWATRPAATLATAPVSRS